MQRYKYKAKDQAGKEIKGEVEASNESLAVKLIREKQLTVISMVPKNAIPFANLLSGITERISSGDIANFTRQFATMVNAGLPLTESLLILRSQSSGKMQAVISQVLAEVEEGQSLSSVMSKFPNVFSKTYVALIKAGETGGVLDEVLLRLADNMENSEEFKGKVKSAMIYPVIIIFGMIAVAFVMLVFVIPKLTDLYDQFDAELPFATRFLIGLSDFMVSYWPIVLVLAAIGGYSFLLYKKTPDGRRRVDGTILSIPLFGPLQKQIILTNLARTLSLMVGSGVSILESLAITSGVVGNVVISDALDDSAKMVEKGFPVALAFSRHPEAFPFIFSQMTAVGEETGKMDEVLAKVAHVFEVESNQKVKAMTSAIEPIILLILGVGVAFLVISIIMPIYNLTTSI
ncbi:type II secretion system F family protein [Candidatus Woesebacteria bacterium]|nr:MAG: type II secretion system F family protein [Candidatus Woesebacteria bacterium]